MSAEQQAVADKDGYIVLSAADFTLSAEDWRRVGAAMRRKSVPTATVAHPRSDESKDIHNTHAMTVRAAPESAGSCSASPRLHRLLQEAGGLYSERWSMDGSAQGRKARAALRRAEEGEASVVDILVVAGLAMGGGRAAR